MQIFEIPTDDSLRSTLQYGGADFPFEFYYDDIMKYKDSSVAWHWHRELEFSLAVSGVVSCQIGEASVELTAGEGLFINSGAIHGFTTPGGGVVMHIIFSPEFIAPRQSAVYNEYVAPVLSSEREYFVLAGENAELCRSIGDICEEARGGPGRRLRIYAQTVALWEAFTRLVPCAPEGGRSAASLLAKARLREMLAFIGKNYAERVTLGEVAAAANISRSEALRCFRLGIQTTPVSYLNDLRLTRARERLVSTADSVTAVAAATGFESAGYFCKVFKKKYNLTPNAFRRQHR